jgi:hypothetical protein
MLKSLAGMFLSVFFTATNAWGAPHTFTLQDSLYYTISLQGRVPGNGETYVSPFKLLEIGFGVYDPSRTPSGAPETPPLQYLNVKTKGGSVIANRRDLEGLTVTRDTWNERKRFGTKRLEVRFEKATCTDLSGVSSGCTADLLLTTNKPDFKKGPVFEPRTLVITTSIGQTFRFRSGRRDLRTAFRLPPRRRPLSITNSAFERINRKV